jgi:hypothetical protein
MIVALKRTLSLSLVIIFSLAGFINIDAIAQSGKRSDAMLTYYEKTKDNKYNCCLKYLSDGDSIVLATFNTLPLDALWDTLNKSVSYILSDGTYKCNYLQKPSSDKIGDGVPDNNEFGSAWVDSTTNKIRISYYISYSELGNDQKKKYSELRTKTGYLPAWGDSGIAFISEMDRDGKWNSITSAATKTAADLTPGLNVLDQNYIKENKNVISTQNLIMNSTCRQMAMKSDMVRYLDTTEYRKYNIDQKTAGITTEFKLISINKKYDLIVAVFWGEADSPHFTAPFYVVNKLLNTSTVMKGTAYYQAGIQVSKDYILFASEYENTFPKIFDLKTFDIIWSNVSAVKTIMIGK